MKIKSNNVEFSSYDVEVYSLDNGFDVLLKQDDSFPVVSMQAWCNTGSINEGDLLGSGLSHFLEHMVFKGTKHYSSYEISEKIQSNGGQINAYTSFDRTVYWIDSISSGYTTCLDILCDIISNSIIPEEEFNVESDVIRKEIAMGEDDPNQVLFQSLFKTAYRKSPYMYPIIGYRDLFDKLTRDDLYSYYNNNYCSNNMFIVLVGNFNRDKSLDIIKNKLQSLKRGKTNYLSFFDEDKLLSKRKSTVYFSTDTCRADIAWQIPPIEHSDIPSIDIISSILTGGKSSILSQSIREDKQLVRTIGTYPYTSNSIGQFILSFDTEYDKLEKSKYAIFKELDSFLENNLSEENFEKAKIQICKNQFSCLSSFQSLASDIGENWLLTKDYDFTKSYIDKVQSASLSDIEFVFNKYIDTNCFVESNLLPKKFKNTTKINKLNKRDDNFRKFELSNGLVVLLLSDSKIPISYVTGVFKGGLINETRNNNGITKLLSNLLTKDTKIKSSKEISHQIESIGGYISGSAGNNSLSVSVSAMSSHNEFIVNLLSESLNCPLFLEEVLNKEKKFQIDNIRVEKDFPFNIAFKKLKEKMYGEHPYSMTVSGTESSVDSLNLEELFSFKDEIIYGNNGVIGMYGDIDLNKSEDYISSLLSNSIVNKLPNTNNIHRDKNSFLNIGNNTHDIHHDKEQAIIIIGYKTVPLDHPDNYPLDIIDEMCSDMSSRLFTRIREELGLAYSVGASRMLGIDSGIIVFYASTSNNNLNRVQDEIILEINSFKNDNFPEQEFKKAKISLLARETMSNQNMKSLSFSATVDELLGIGWDNYKKIPSIINSISIDKVREVAKKYLVEENQVIVRLISKK